MQPSFQSVAALVASKARRVASIVSLCVFAVACGGSGANSVAASPVPPVAAAPVPTASLAKAYTGLFLMGSAVTASQVDATNTATLLAREFNVLVAENAMKPQLIGKSEGVYDFAEADKIVAFAQAHGMKMRGHTLLWHNQQADWMFKNGSGPAGQPTKSELTARLQKYVTDVVGHFKRTAPGVVFAWDVVNEAFVPDESGVAQVNGWRKSNWLDILGEDYIAIAFAAAQAADPDALLFYNDYGTESPKKRALILSLIDSLKAKGIAIHGIGHQSHYAMSYPKDWSDLQQSLVEIAGKTNVAGKPLTNHITELDIALNPGTMDNLVTNITPAMLEAQALRYQSFFQMLLKHRDKVSAVLVWGIDDDHSWLRTWPMTRLEGPLLFDAQLQAKPAYTAVEKLGREYPR